jgi:bifunctional DNA-binding transcriptional regulator/antitoxin component of YhaV-PrlF toxin-antitoxin module
MKKKQSSTSIVVKLDKGTKTVTIPRELLEQAGFSDGTVVLIEVVDGTIVIKSPSVNFGRYIGILSGDDRT